MCACLKISRQTKTISLIGRKDLENFDDDIIFTFHFFGVGLRLASHSHVAKIVSEGFSLRNLFPSLVIVRMKQKKQTETIENFQQVVALLVLKIDLGGLEGLVTCSYFVLRYQLNVQEGFYE